MIHISITFVKYMYVMRFEEKMQIIGKTKYVYEQIKSKAPLISD